ncbi:MAG: DUF423 domain-containing protein [Bacteriovoracaceae bacterium]|jgi:uncharacterized membrane protein YgdD (TMEM256/DUF423 family)|nr:DUF423 domain-containing protein [Bacteriovoracaceae bacterium]
MTIKNQFKIAALIMFLAVAIGAFGAHGLKLSGKALKTFSTGSDYHFYHGFALFMMALLNSKFNNIFARSYKFFFIGILLFSFNCYLYGITSIKTFAMIVPIGGILFLIGWLNVFIKAKEIK